MGLPQPADMVDCALLVSKLDCQARLLVQEYSYLLYSKTVGSPGRGEKSFSAASCQDVMRPSGRLVGRGAGREEEERGRREARRGLCAGCVLISAASQH